MYSSTRYDECAEPQLLLMSSDGSIERASVRSPVVNPCARHPLITVQCTDPNLSSTHVPAAGSRSQLFTINTLHPWSLAGILPYREGGNLGRTLSDDMSIDAFGHLLRFGRSRCSATEFLRPLGDDQEPESATAALSSRLRREVTGVGIVKLVPPAGVLAKGSVQTRLTLAGTLARRPRSEPEHQGMKWR
jgi:hypothetical protein